MSNTPMVNVPTAPGAKTWLRPAEAIRAAVAREIEIPSAFVRFVLWLSVFGIPFNSFYIPGTGEHLGVVRIIQVLVLLAMLAQPAVCLRRWPVALSWFVGYCILRIVWGLWMTPQLASDWWPSTSRLLQFELPWTLFLYNLLRFPQLVRAGLWAFGLGTSFCAMLHLAGIGVDELDRGLEGRTSLLGENANVLGANYAAALVIMVGLLIVPKAGLRHRLLLLGLIPLNGLGLAMTGSRTAALLVGLGFLLLLVSNFTPGHRVRGLMVLLLTAGILGGVLCTVPTVFNRFETFRSHDPRREPRARMLPVLWEMFQRNPLLGSGPDNYQHELTQRALPYLFKKNKVISAHNLLLLLLVETGLVGFFVFARGFGMALASAWRARRTSAVALPLALLLPTAIAALTSSDPHYQSMFWFTIAYALAGHES